MFWPAITQRQQAAAEEAQYRRRRQDEFEDWKARQRWAAQPDAPASTDENADVLAVLPIEGPANYDWSATMRPFSRPKPWWRIAP